MNLIWFNALVFKLNIWLHEEQEREDFVKIVFRIMTEFARNIIFEPKLLTQLETGKYNEWNNNRQYLLKNKQDMSYRILAFILLLQK